MGTVGAVVAADVVRVNRNSTAYITVHELKVWLHSIVIFWIIDKSTFHILMCGLRGWSTRGHMATRLLRATKVAKYMFYTLNYYIGKIWGFTGAAGA